MKTRKRQDDRVLEAQKGRPQCKPGDPCPICGRPRTLDTGHAFYKGSFYCDLEEGPGALTAREWLEAQQDPKDAGKLPRTTAWNIKQRWERTERRVGGSSSPGRKPHKLRICQRCLQPARKDFGHSRLEGTSFCALHAGKRVELWLAEARDRKRRQQLKKKN
ncbi:unnamed protein product [Merluccius merluccius]